MASAGPSSRRPPASSSRRTARSPTSRRRPTTRSPSSAATPRASSADFGKLTFLSERHEGEASGLGGAATGLDGARQTLVSPDGQHLYVASAESDAIVVFQRNPATGSLKYIGVHRDEAISACVQPTSCVIHSLNGAGALAVDPSGANLYAAASDDDALSVFVRAGAPPAFAFTGGQPASNPPAPVRNGVGGVSGLRGVTEVARGRPASLRGQLRRRGRARLDRRLHRGRRERRAHPDQSSAGRHRRSGRPRRRLGAGGLRRQHLRRQPVARRGRQRPRRLPAQHRRPAWSPSSSFIARARSA